LQLPIFQVAVTGMLPEEDQPIRSTKLFSDF
jgi:hypothetical protein